MFTENQSRQLYVVTDNAADAAAIKESPAAGKIALGETSDGKELFFVHQGATDDGLQRSDLVNKCNIMSISATAAADMAHKKSKYEITLDTNVSANPIVGQAYILNIIIKNYIANGDDSIKVKFGATKAMSTDKSALFKNLALNLAKNFSREPVPVIKITLKGGDGTEITNKTKLSDLSATTATGIVIEEVEQPWRLGAAKQEFVNLDIQPSTVFDGNTDQIWGVVTDVTSTNNAVIPNSKKIADMEYFYHKNRGDIYGNMCWPLNIDTKYLVNPALAAGYSTIDIHYYYEGNSHNVGHSEKTITLVGEHAKMTALLTKITAKLNGYNVTVNKSASWG